MDRDHTDTPVTLEAARAEWCDLATSHMALLDSLPPYVEADSYRTDVEDGSADLIAVYAVEAGERERVGTVITRIVAGAAGRELVIVAAGGQAPVNATAAMFPLWEELARRAGCVAVRFETSRMGLAKWAMRRGWKAETVNMRIDL